MSAGALSGDDTSRPLFVGSQLQKIDEKRRVAIPKPHRDAVVPARDGSTFFLLHAVVDRCLWLMPERSFLRFVRTTVGPLREKTGSGIGSEMVRAFESRLLGEARAVEPDKQGRIVLPQELCELSGITDESEFRGTGYDRVEIWNPSTRRERDSKIDYERMARELFG